MANKKNKDGSQCYEGIVGLIVKGDFKDKIKSTFIGKTIDIN